MARKIIIANFKMTIDMDEVDSYFTRLALLEHKMLHHLIVAIPSVFIAYITHKYKTAVAAQDVSCLIESFGPYTGEVSAAALRSCGAMHCIVGHYERFKFGGETYNNVYKKLEYCTKHHITPILCIGDNYHHNSKIVDVLCEAISISDKLIVAYEPYQNINSEIQDVDAVLAKIQYVREFLIDRSTKSKLVYGGSVTTCNINAFLSSNMVDGVMIGRLSSGIINLESLFDK